MGSEINLVVLLQKSGGLKIYTPLMEFDWKRELAALSLVALSGCSPHSGDPLPPVERPPVLLADNPLQVPDWNRDQLNLDLMPSFGPQLPSPDIFQNYWANWKKRVEQAGGLVRMYDSTNSFVVVTSEQPNPLYNYPDLSGRVPRGRWQLPPGQIFPYQTIVEAQFNGNRLVYAGMFVDQKTNTIVRTPSNTTFLKAALILRNNQKPVMRDINGRGPDNAPILSWQNP